ncbi:MAG TPA: hypothetical protein VF017_13940 [Thermoanaerobaculia bacterium]|nr:hypothetical protein [Thermoanaerobaculia bacterium]
MSRGDLAAENAQILLRARRRFALRAAALGVLALAFLVAAGWVALAGAETVPAGLAVLLAGVGVFWLVKLRPALALWRGVGEDLRSGEVDVTTRPVSLEIAIGLGILGVQHHLLRSGDELFEIDRATAARLEAGRTYRLRVARKSRTLLGIEEPEESVAAGSGRA